MKPKISVETLVKNFQEKDWTSPPNQDQLELTVFGPGFGESCLVHLGSNNWIIVDSCINVESRSVAPLEYLEALGCDPSAAVKLIVATHWHDDHVRGLSKVVTRCQKALFSCSNALTSEEFLAMIDAFNRQRMVKGGSGVREIHTIVSHLAEAKRAPIRFASASRPLLHIDAASLQHGFAARVASLSPSDREYELALRHMAQLIPTAGMTQYRCPAPDPNLTSAVVWVEVGSVRMLLGADLEQTSDSDRGWSAILLDGTKPQGLAQLFKIPHHGSKNAHNPSVWTEMVVNSPLSVTTPWTRGARALPTREDQARLLRNAPDTFLSATPAVKRTSKRLSKPVVKTLRESNQKVTEIEPKMGAVRFRNGGVSAWNVWHISLCGPARRLSVGKGSPRATYKAV